MVEIGDNKRACHFSLVRQFFVSVFTFLTKKLRDSSNFRFRTLSREEMRRAERWTLEKRGKRGVAVLFSLSGDGDIFSSLLHSIEEKKVTFFWEMPLCCSIFFLDVATAPLALSALQLFASHPFTERKQNSFGHFLFYWQKKDFRAILKATPPFSAICQSVMSEIFFRPELGRISPPRQGCSFFAPPPKKWDTKGSDASSEKQGKKRRRRRNDNRACTWRGSRRGGRRTIFLTFVAAFSGSQQGV